MNHFTIMDSFMINIIYDNLLNSMEKYISHQCNCLTQHSAGTALSIFNKYPYANTYKNRDKSDSLGTIKILGDGIDNRFVINMFAQHYPGKPKYPNSQLDGIQVRQQSFYQCLLKISKIPELESIAFPYGIGCNLAGGNWEYYYGVLNNFASYMNKSFLQKWYYTNLIQN